MSQFNNMKLLESIKKDDLAHFSFLIKNNESLCFGRFPILTMCYIYKSRNIIKAYEEKLIKIQNYKIIDESFEIYKAFKSIAGRALRFYLEEDSIVSPLEILALIHNDKQLKKLYKNEIVNEKIIKNLQQIYKINSQEIQLTKAEIRISKKHLSKFQKLPYKIAFGVSCGFIVIASLIFALLNFSCGFGSSWSPFIIYNESQLYMALKTDGNYILGNNIVIENIETDIDFLGTLNGNNYTLYIKDLNKSNFIKSNKGQLKNLNIVYDEINRQITESFSFLVNANTGLIDNVKIYCLNANFDCVKNSSLDIFINGFANVNEGTISNSKLNLKASLVGTGQGECYFTGITGRNLGTVDSCVLENNSEISSIEIDISGICAFNELNASVLNCKNYSKLSQTSNIEVWSPNVAGIVLTNYGNIKNSYNLNELNCKSTFAEENTSRSVYLGGICSMNYGNITKCLNKGDLTAISNKLTIYCGGISAHSMYYLNNQTYYISNIIDCGSDCHVSAKSEAENAYVYAGGISGYYESLIANYRLYGSIANCFSLSTFENGNDETKYFVGSFVGSSYLYSSFLGNIMCMYLSNDFVLKQDNVEYQIGCLIIRVQDLVTQEYKINIVNKGLNSLNEEIKNFSTREELMQKEIYWNE